jgi:hypothetical protein
MTTRYSTANIVLMIAEALLCVFTSFLLIMTAGFGADPVHDFRSFAIVCMLCVGLLSCPSFLLAIRWSRLGSTAMWCVAICTLLIAVLGGVIQHFLGLVILLFIQALICGAINAGSRGRQIGEPKEGS